MARPGALLLPVGARRAVRGHRRGRGDGLLRLVILIDGSELYWPLAKAIWSGACLVHFEDAGCHFPSLSHRVNRTLGDVVSVHSMNEDEQVYLGITCDLLDVEAVTQALADGPEARPPERVRCLPAKLFQTDQPTTVGLGDTFVGGFLDEWRGP